MTTLTLVSVTSQPMRGHDRGCRRQRQARAALQTCLLVLNFSRVSASGCDRVGVFELKPRHDLPDHSLQETLFAMLLVTGP